MNSRISGTVGIICFAAFLPSVSAQILFTENFDANHTANWRVNSSPGVDSAANFFFDYSTAGIPPAPNSSGTTRGLKLEANMSSNVFGGISVSPTNQSFSGDYILKFDIWWNFNGPAPTGGSGSTQLTGAGIGTTGTTAQWPGGTQNSVWFAVTPDGNSSSDYRAYSTAAPTVYPSGSLVYQAPSHSTQAADPYYASFGGNTPPAAQTSLFPQQTGTSGAGAPAFRWHTGRIIKFGNTVTFTLNGIPIVVIDLTTVTLSGGNIHFVHSDSNATSSTDSNDRNLLFGLIDNVVVRQIPPLRIDPMIRPSGDDPVLLSSSGVPGRTYDLQAAADLSALKDGVVIDSTTANADGVIFLKDPDAPIFPKRFYRLDLRP